MSGHAELETRRAALQMKLEQLYTSLTASKTKLEEFETEYELMQDHAEKLTENVTFLRNEAPVVKLKEYKQSVNALATAKTMLQNLEWSLDTARSECRMGLKQADVWLQEIKSIDAILSSEATVHPFPNDKRRNQDAD
jgi:chromosome segregation ATPase